MTQRLIVVAGSVLAVLLLVVVVLLGVVVWQNAEAAERERFERARATCEQLIGPASGDNLDEYAECRDRLIP